MKKLTQKQNNGFGYVVTTYLKVFLANNQCFAEYPRYFEGVPLLEILIN